ncbi:MAG: acyl-CoA synthetase [Hyphomicrobiaceae bacterium]
MYVGDHALNAPDRPALIHAATGATITYRELDERSNRLAHLLRSHGLQRGAHIALLMENNPRFMEVVWAALRAGLYVTAINRYLTPDEAAYVVNDCDAEALVTSYAMREGAAPLTGLIPNCRLRLMTDGVIDGWSSYEAATANHPATRIADESLGDTMLYSSGTTGRPKGIKRPLLPPPGLTEWRHRGSMAAYGFSPETVYLSPAPIYHAAPLAYVLGVHFFGGTVVMMESFDAVASLAHIERYRVTHSQWVPTMFVRLLRLSAEDKARHDLSTHRVAIHAAAPCPIEVKRQMIDWWGPILHEYYAGTEGNGTTRIDSKAWLERPGSVGRAAVGILHICDDDGRELPPGEAGTIYFERDEMPFAYHKDADKTRAAQHPRHPNWSALGDIGYVDADGYLYLTDRKAFMIISGGVNIYPQIIEDALILHPQVADVAVFGVPNAEMGEEVKAVVELTPGQPPSTALADELIAFARTRVAAYMVPRSIDFIDTMPRLPTGKLYKRVLKDRYWPPKP